MAIISALASVSSVFRGGGPGWSSLAADPQPSWQSDQAGRPPLALSYIARAHGVPRTARLKKSHPPCPSVSIAATMAAAVSQAVTVRCGVPAWFPPQLAFRQPALPKFAHFSEAGPRVWAPRTGELTLPGWKPPAHA